MIRHGERPKFVLVLTVAASVLLFACSGPVRESAPEAERATGETQAPPPGAPQAPEPAPPSAASLTGSAPEQAPSSAPAPPPPARSAAAGEVTFGTVPQEEETAVPRPARPMPKAGTSRVFSNDDLKAYKDVREEFGFGENARPAGGAAAASGEGNGDDAGGESAEDRDARIAEAEGKLQDLAAELENLEKRIPSLHNPLLPRVRPLEKDATAEEGMDNVARLARVKQRIAEVRSEMETLQRELVELRSSEAPAGPPRDDQP